MALIIPIRVAPPLCNWRDQTSVKCFCQEEDEIATVRLIVKYDGVLRNVSFDFREDYLRSLIFAKRVISLKTITFDCKDDAS